MLTRIVPLPDSAMETVGFGHVRVNREMEVLLGHLEAQRGHVLGILDGLSEEQLRRPVLPSGWHCLGLVKHLALADEHYWFRTALGRWGRGGVMRATSTRCAS